MPEAVCGYYGKLPVSPEFLRFHAAGPEVRELDEWFERGIQYAKTRAGSEWPTLVSQADVWNFLFVPEGEGRAVCGAVFASRDRAGRSFPFLTFLLLECQRASPAPWLIPLQCRLFLETARRLLHQLRLDLDWEAFRARAELLENEVAPDGMSEAGFHDYLSRTTVTEFRTGLGDEGEDTTEPTSDAGPHASSHPCSQVSGWGWSHPLLKGSKGETYDVPFWLEYHARWSEARSNPLSTTLAFWNRDPSRVAPCILVSVGCPSPNLARFIISPELGDDAWGNRRVWSPDAQETGVGCSVDCPTDVGADGQRSLRQYLDSLGGSHEGQRTA